MAFRLAASDRNGVGLLCSCRAFSETARTALLAMEDGDSVAVSGETALSTWTGNDGAPRHGLDVLVNRPGNRGGWLV